jgi:hypothetical protein
MSRGVEQAARLNESAQGNKALIRQHKKERQNENVRPQVLKGNALSRLEPELKLS